MFDIFEEIPIDEYLNILDKMEFFNQRAGRELWFDKPKNIQDKDIENFNRDINILKEYILKQKKLQVKNEKFERNMKNVLKIEKKNAVKEFAEKLKAIISEKGTLVRDYTGDELVLRCEIDVNDVIELIDGLLK